MKTKQVEEFVPFKGIFMDFPTIHYGYLGRKNRFGYPQQYIYVLFCCCNEFDLLRYFATIARVGTSTAIDGVAKVSFFLASPSAFIKLILI